MFEEPKIGESQENKVGITHMSLTPEDKVLKITDRRHHPKEFVITRDGKTELIKAEEVVAKIEKDGVSISVEAENAEHIYSTHVAPDAPAGSKFEGIPNLETLFGLIRDRIDFLEVAKRLADGQGPLKEHKYVDTVDIGQKMKCGVATFGEAQAQLGITNESLEDYRTNWKQRIIEANRNDDAEARKALIKEYNDSHPGSNMYLGERFPHAPITPFFDGAPITTTELSVIITDGKLVTTMPGHHREKLPFAPKAAWDFAKPEEKEKLIAQFGSEAAAMAAITEDFAINAEDWAEAGFIQARKKE